MGIKFALLQFTWMLRGRYAKGCVAPQPKITDYPKIYKLLKKEGYIK